MLMKGSIIFGIIILSLIVLAFKSEEPWTTKQLLAPTELAIKLKNAKAEQPLILSVGEAGLIKNAVQIGAMSENESIPKLKALLNITSKNKEIIIYCGCCPFEHCPNIRPAFKLLNEMKFTNQKLLNLPQNLKVDWIDKGYPMNAN